MTICKSLLKTLLPSLYEYREFIRKIRTHKEWVFLEMQMCVFNIGSSEQVLGKGTYNTKHRTNFPITLSIQFLRVH